MAEKRMPWDANHMPSEQEIAQKTLEIRRGWTLAERERRGRWAAPQPVVLTPTKVMDRDEG